MERDDDIERQIVITNCTDRDCDVSYQGVKMLIHAIIPSGVELRGAYSYLYKAASQAYVDEVKTAREARQSAITHCEKLLSELPIALANSVATLAAHVEAVDCELSHMGAMLIEQKRIKQEIETRKIELEQLKATPVPQLEIEKYTQHTHQTRIIMPLGLSQLDGKFYHVLHIDQAVRDAAPNATHGIESAATENFKGSQVAAISSLDISPSLA